jgi:hypothetical protein
MLPDSIPVAMTVAPATAALAESLTTPTIVPDDTLTVGLTACSAITGNAQAIMDAETKRLRRQVSIFITSSLPFPGALPMYPESVYKRVRGAVDQTMLKKKGAV